MSEHTSTPWATHERLDETGGTLIVRRSTGPEDDYHVADCSVQFQGQGSGENAANATFIIKAVNCHDELVAALRTALGAVDHPDIGTYDMDGQSFYEAIHKAKAAITEALEKAR